MSIVCCIANFGKININDNDLNAVSSHNLKMWNHGSESVEFGLSLYNVLIVLRFFFIKNSSSRANKYYDFEKGLEIEHWIFRITIKPVHVIWSL